MLETKIPPLPIVKWAGGKRQLQSQIISKFPPKFDSYHEPFLGGGAIFFALNPQNAFISDTNQGLINLYIQIRDRPTNLNKILNQIEIEYNNLKSLELKAEYFYTIRKEFNEDPHKRVGLDMAAFFLFLNKTGFNGMYRESKSGIFNIPFGKRSSVKLAQFENIQRVSFSLQNKNLNVCGYENALMNMKSGDLAYFDPPYSPISATSSFTSYHRTGFTPEDQAALANKIRELAESGVMVAVSNSENDIIRELYKGFHFHTLPTQRTIGAASISRKIVTELLITSYSK